MNQEQDLEKVKENLRYWFNYDHIDGIDGSMLLAGIYPTEALHNFFSGELPHLHGSLDSMIDYGIGFLDGSVINSRRICEPELVHGDPFVASSELVRARRQKLRDEVQPFFDSARYVQRLWHPGANPPVTPLTYFVEWARKKDIPIGWESVAVEMGLVKAERRMRDGREEKPLTDSERNTLLKQIASLSLALAEKSNRYKRGDKPNALKIAEATMEILDALPDANARGVGNSSIRESIKAGLELLTMTKQ